MHYGDALHLL